MVDKLLIGGMLLVILIMIILNAIYWGGVYHDFGLWGTNNGL